MLFTYFTYNDIRFFFFPFKVGASPEIANVLNDIRREGDVSNRNCVVSSCCWGADPELDEFMVSLSL